MAFAMSAVASAITPIPRGATSSGRRAPRVGLRSLTSKSRGMHGNVYKTVPRATIEDGVFEAEILSPLSAEVIASIVESLRKDLEGQYADGFTYTPFASDLQFVDPVVALEGRVSYNLLWSPLWFAMNQILEPSSLEFKLVSLEVIEAAADPLATVPNPPREDAPRAPREAVCAVHAVWETFGTGKYNFEAGGFKLLEQQPFYMSGQDVFRIDASGRVMRHESAWDQSPSALAAYGNPLAHSPAFSNIIPFFADQVVKKPEPPSEDAEDEAVETIVSPPPSAL